MLNEAFSFLRDESGLTVVEYVVAAGLLASILIGVFASLEDAQIKKLSSVINGSS
jgi:pilus assembly protein Flp/PilA